MKKLLLTILTIALFSCGSNDEGDSPTLSRISISSSLGLLLDLNETTILTATGFDQSNNNVPLSSVTWSTSNANVTVDQNGQAVAVTVGTTIITAESEGIESTISVRIWDSTAPRTEIYVSDAGNGGNPPYQILKFDGEGNNPEVFTTQNLAWPQDLVFLEDDGVVLISNLNSNSIGRYNIETGNFMSNFATGINGPTRMKIGPDNLLYVLQWNNTTPVLRYRLDGTLVDEFTSVGINQAIGIDWDSEGNLYVSSFAEGNVRKFDTSGTDQGLFIDSNLQGPTNIWFDNNGDLLANDWSAGVVARFDSEGVFQENIITGLAQPEGVDFLRNGNMLIGNGGTGAVKMYDTSNNFLEDLVPSRSGNLLTPNAVVLRHIN